MIPAVPPARSLLALSPIIVLGLLGQATAAPAAERYYMSRITADVSLNSSPWSKLNDAAGGCKGVGPMRTDVNRSKLYARFRCTVDDGAGNARGVVLVATAGPQQVLVTKVESGELTADVPIGAIPRGTPRMRNVEAGPAVERSAWAADKELFGVLCYGVGRFRSTQSGELFSTFVCRVRIIGSPPAIVLVQARRARTVRVVRTLA